MIFVFMFDNISTLFTCNFVSLNFCNFDLVCSSAPPPEDIELKASPEESQIPKDIKPTEIQPLLSGNENQPLYDQNKAQEEDFETNKIR